MKGITLVEFLTFLSLLIPVTLVFVKIIASVVEEVTLLKERQKNILLRINDVEKFLAECSDNPHKRFRLRSYDDSTS